MEDCSQNEMEAILEMETAEVNEDKVTESYCSERSIM
jgi:hypothetical protein